MISDVNTLISKLSSISLEELTAVEFDSRVDTKFVFHENQLTAFLEKIKHDLVVLEVNENRSFNYENIYCDDEKYFFFNRHHAGFGNRSKVRVRKYGTDGPFYFEVKNKTNKGKTVKYRIPLQSYYEFENSQTSYLVREYTGLDFSELSKHTDVKYKRVTLANTNLTEKLTLDLELYTSNEKASFDFKNLVIVEVKQVNYSSKSLFIRSLKEMKIYQTSFSKYCSSIALLNPRIKQNRFKKIITNVKNIANA